MINIKFTFSHQQLPLVRTKLDSSVLPRKFKWLHNVFTVKRLTICINVAHPEAPAHAHLYTHSPIHTPPPPALNPFLPFSRETPHCREKSEKLFKRMLPLWLLFSHPATCDRNKLPPLSYCMFFSFGVRGVGKFQRILFHVSNLK